MAADGPQSGARHLGSPADVDTAPLAGRRVAVALAGGIACYKTATLVSRLAQAGAEVRVLMTESATRFVTPLTFQSLSGKPVLTSIWQSDDKPDSQHVGVARSCDLLVIAPATADLLAKLAAGLADDVVCLVAAAMPRETPVLLAPAMNAQMWESPITQRNLTTLRELLGWRVVGPESGWQACRTLGAGRMSEPEAIYDAVCDQLSAAPRHTS
ncbi:MAG: flavoprotein [Phycisphaeraceae bacterium]